MNQQIRYVPKSVRRWIEPTALEQLMRIQEEINKAEQWKRREPAFITPDVILLELRKREVVILTELEKPNG